MQKVELCGVNTTHLPLLSDKEKEILLKRMKNGDSNARQEFIYGNLRLVLSVIRRFNSSGESSDDLFQIGCIGLMKAVDNFDTTLNVKFSTYAVPMIMGEVRRFLRDNSVIRVSRSLKDIAYKALAAKEAMTKRNLTEPTISDISKETGFCKEDIVYALDAIQTPMSLYEPVYTEGADALFVMDQVSDKKNREEAWVEQISLSEAMKHLGKRETEIVTLRFYEGRTQTEVATLVGISQAQVSRLEKNALHIMQQYMHVH